MDYTGKMINLEEAVVRKIKTAQHILCTVESCTGGLLSHLVTNVSGASEIYWGSFVTYDNSAKTNLGVSSQLIEKFGAVSAEVVQEMAQKGLEKMQASLSRSQSISLIKPKGLACIATSGIAGPGGGSREKPVGLCYIGLALSGRTTCVEKFQATGPLDRVNYKNQFAIRALELIRSYI